MDLNFQGYGRGSSELWTWFFRGMDVDSQGYGRGVFKIINVVPHGYERNHPSYVITVGPIAGPGFVL